MEIQSKSITEQIIHQKSVINFPNGIPGFEEQTQFQLFQMDDNEIVFLLQSTQDETIGFSVSQPYHFNINYQFILTDEEEKTLQLDSLDDLLIVLILHNDENTGFTLRPSIKGSIKSPLLINTKKKLGLQKVLSSVEQTITFTEKRNEIDVMEA